MANAITKFKKYIDLLDEVYKLASVTADLDGDSTLVRAGANANEIIIPKISMDGLANYSRNGGYVGGDVTLTNETVTFNYDRGRSFVVDAMDNEETVGLAFGKLASEFIRTKVAPEMDAFRLAAYASTAGISKVSAGATLSSGEAVLAALVAAYNKMDEDEVPQELRELLITPTLYNLVHAVDTTKSKEILGGFSKIVKVPQSRFYTAVKLNDGTTSGEEAGGFTKASGAKDINFMVIHKPALLQYTKHMVNKVITPEENQTSDGYIFHFRAYGLADVYENKVAGIYLHHKA
nr:MAG TPA: Major capsid protein [Caudoviricetes sp.]